MKSSRERAKNIFSTTREIAKSDESKHLKRTKATLFHRRRIHIHATMAFVDLTPYILSFSEWVADQGAWGPVYYALLLALWVMMCLPCRQVPLSQLPLMAVCPWWPPSIPPYYCPASARIAEIMLPHAFC